MCVVWLYTCITASLCDIKYRSVKVNKQTLSTNIAKKLFKQSIFNIRTTHFFFNSQMLECLKEEIENMRPPSDALENFRLLLVGPVGSGKSSFCNTVASVFRGRITQRAMVGESNNSVTTTVSSYLFILSLRWC